MKKEVIQQLHTSFEDVANEQDGVEFWLARDLQMLLGYDEWRNFAKVIDKAKESCENARVAVEDQFVEVNKLITHGKGDTGASPISCSPATPVTSSPKTATLLKNPSRSRNRISPCRRASKS